MSERSRRREYRASPAIEYGDENHKNHQVVKALAEKNAACERLYSELKALLHSELKTQVEQKQDRLLNHQDPDFLGQREKIRQEYEEKLQRLLAYRTLQNDQLDRVEEAERHIIDTQYENDSKNAVKSLKRAIRKKKQQLLLEENNVNSSVASYIADENELANLMADLSEKPRIEVPKKTVQNERKRKGTDTMRELLEADKNCFNKVFAAHESSRNSPRIVLSLKPTQIEDDLMEIATAVEVRKEYDQRAKASGLV
uniref:DUF4200 domain-containing protein n=1 Tax=Steinernema glaseri TaxID=37863 RepID=A0A1I7Y9X6_9BILA